MQSDQLVGLIIAASSVIGGLAIGAIAIIISVPWSFREKLAKLEASSKERMALIEKGVDPALIMKPKNVIGNDPLFWGLLCVGLGGGSALGIMISDLTGHKPETYSSSIAVLCTGIALVYYFVYRKRSTDQKAA
ncbi:MAG: hypothetical protein JST42_26115 [Bacteroidetes bacterium]|nr:hypothetical protein [Bacteroidota bacterium]